tara:strand:+ start:624 stop:929 length:306 start_codon:yes stop_codon:yes gene_type:complete
MNNLLAEEYINTYNPNLCITKILKHLKQNHNITENDFNNICIDGGYKTRFNGNGHGKCALMNRSNCWLKKYQNKYGPIIEESNNTYILRNVWKNILNKTNL